MTQRDQKTLELADDMVRAQPISAYLRAREALIAHLETPAVPDGWVCVPKEPTLEMVIAMENWIGRHAWRRGIAAAPKEQT